MTNGDSYRTAVVDPPWRQKGGPLAGGHGEHFVGAGNSPSLDLPYPTLSVQEIACLLKKLFNQYLKYDAHMYLWTTNKFLPQAFNIAEQLGFKYSTTLVWAKQPMGRGLGGAFGISTEFCLFCRRGTLPSNGKIGRSWWSWTRPYEQGVPNHSAKPHAFYRLVEDMSPGPHIDIFARNTRPAWGSWGDEIPDGVTHTKEHQTALTLLPTTTADSSKETTE